MEVSVDPRIRKDPEQVALQILYSKTADADALDACLRKDGPKQLRKLRFFVTFRIPAAPGSDVRSGEDNLLPSRLLEGTDFRDDVLRRPGYMAPSSLDRQAERAVIVAPVLDDHVFPGVESLFLHIALGFGDSLPLGILGKQLDP